MFGRFALALAALPAAIPPAQSGGLHKDEELGFQIQVPKDWKAVPLAAGERWMVAKYLSNREYQTKKEWGYLHTPEMRVILFPAEVVKDRGPKVKKKEDGTAISVRFKSDYVDYKSYIEKNSYGGYFFDKEEETTVNGIPATCYEIKFEKLTVPRRAVAWVFKGEDAEWAVHFEVLEDWWEKLAPEFTRCLKSFKFIPRKGSVTARAGDDDLGFDTIFEIGKSSPAERALKRAALFEQAVKEAEGRLPEGWTKKNTRNFHAFSHTDDRYTARVLEQAEALVGWLGQNCAWVGDGVPGPAILRICKDREEYSSFQGQSSDISFVNSFEIATFKDREGWGSAFWNMNGELANPWFADKNPRLRWGMPPWLNEGISHVFSSASAKGGKVQFKPDEWDRERLRDIRQKGRLATARTLLGADDSEMSKVEDSWVQCGTFLRFLWTGPKAAQTKELFKKYLQTYVAVLEEEETAEEAASKVKEKKGKTEEEKEAEEEARFKERRQGEKKRLEEVLKRVFGSWTEAEWAAFERAYASAAE
ncbi:MAG: DUF4367 domain-containing protein [Planctomycetes bacterium]|nr:DUF4367 domain-containing protein [Planctomycetota bacterium]